MGLEPASPPHTDATTAGLGLKPTARVTVLYARQRT